MANIKKVLQICILLFLFNQVIHAEQDTQLAAIEQQIQTLHFNLEKTHDKQSLLLKELEHTERELMELNLSLQKLNKKLIDKRFHLEEQQEQIKKQEQELINQQRLLIQQIQWAYRLGSNNSLKLILNDEDPARLSRLLSYTQYIHQARVKNMQRIEALQRQLKKKQLQLKNNVQQLKKIKQEKNKQYQTLQVKQQYRKTIVKQFKQEIKSKNKELNYLLANKKALERVLAQLPQNGKIQAFARMMRRLPWPTQGKLRNNPKIPGILIHAPKYQAVHAIHPGTVVFSDWLRGFGLLLIIDHGQGYMSLYAHNQQLYKAPGDQVQVGSLIAAVGDSGGELENGLYFEIRKGGKPLNPLHWLKK